MDLDIDRSMKHRHFWSKMKEEKKKKMDERERKRRRERKCVVAATLTLDIVLGFFPDLGRFFGFGPVRILLGFCCFELLYVNVNIHLSIYKFQSLIAINVL